MSPSLVTLATAVLACASTAAAAKAYQIEETYDTSNVNSKWDFFQVCQAVLLKASQPLMPSHFRISLTFRELSW